jgi:WD40 repeat protein
MPRTEIAKTSKTWKCALSKTHKYSELLNHHSRKHPSCMRYLIPALALAVCLGFNAAADDFDSTTATVGRTADGLMTPVNQVVTPAGTSIDLPGIRPQALALSPNGKLLVTAGLTHELIVLNLADGDKSQHVEFPADKAEVKGGLDAPILDPNNKAQLSFTGLVFSPDGSRIYLANVNGDIKVFGVDKTGTVTALFSIALPPANAPRRVNDIPAGIAVSRDGKKLYVALNLSNRLAELDAITGKVLRMWDVGVAPYDVAVVSRKVYVSCWGGRRPGEHTFVGPAGRGTTVRVDNRYIADEGSVAIIHLDEKEQ